MISEKITEEKAQARQKLEKRLGNNKREV